MTDTGPMAPPAATRDLSPTALDHLWMGGTSAALARAQGGPLVLVKGHGVYVEDERGRRYIDAIASLEASAIGHGRPEIARAVAQQYEQLEFLDTLRYTSRPAVRLAERLAALAPDDLEHVHFATSGSEAVEAAMKIARQYHQLRGSHAKYKVIARYRGYHGCTYGAMSLDGNYHRTRKHLFEPLPPIGRFVSAKATPAEFEELIQAERAETIAAILIDPVATSSGIYPAPDSFWTQLRAICDRHDILLIADEVITAFGRTGRWFASHRAGVSPDLITVSKGLSSGYFPISAVIASRRVAREFDGPGRALIHGHTYGAHPVACAAALENLRLIEEERLVERAWDMEAVVRQLLEPLRSHPLVGDYRGAGLIFGVELVDRTRPGEAAFDLGTRVLAALRDRGVLSFVLSPGNLLLLCPALVIRESELQELISCMTSALDDVALERGLGVSG
jgi:adenosylmethionine-8-amino-7-oxononanoate aminotransferase